MPNKSSLYRTILRDYERTRDLAAAELKKKQEKIYHRIPEIQQIDEKISQTGLSIARAVLAQPKKAAELTTKLQNDIALAKKQKADLLEQAGLPKDYLSIKYQYKMYGFFYGCRSIVAKIFTELRGYIK